MCLVSIHQQGPIPGTPIVVADWKEEGHEDGDVSSTTPDADSSGCDHKQSREDDGKTPSIEKEHVQAVYDTIAPHWLVPTRRYATIPQQAPILSLTPVPGSYYAFICRAADWKYSSRGGDFVSLCS